MNTLHKITVEITSNDIEVIRRIASHARACASQDMPPVEASMDSEHHAIVYGLYLMDFAHFSTWLREVAASKQTVKANIRVEEEFTKPVVRQPTEQDWQRIASEYWHRHYQNCPPVEEPIPW